MSLLARIKDALRGTGQDRSEFAGVRRIPAAESPFGVEVWDCRAFTHHRVSTTASADMARRFLELRASEGDEYRGQAPLSAHLVSCNLSYTLPEPFPDGPLFKAEEMEDKWDIYFRDGALYFVRSWSGDLTYKAEVRYQAGQLELTTIATGGNQDPAFAPRVVDYLIKSHLLRRDALHPLPVELPPRPDQIAIFSFSVFGRRCSLGTYADTTAIEPPKT